jgi:pimeloyl-ACP methyl ester carboxylesterase
MRALPCRPHRAPRSRASTRASHATHKASDARTRPPSSVVILPGLGNSSEDYVDLVANLERRGHPSTVVDVDRIDWLRNIAGARTRAYWEGSLRPRPTVDWFLEKCETATRDARDSNPNADVVLVAHSAGGWLARVFLDEYASEESVEAIGGLVTLGSPMTPPPSGVVDQTRGVLTHVRERCRSAEALRREANVEVTCVAGTYVRGRGEMPRGIADVGAFVAGLGYRQVCGRADAEGDGITPVETALMPGATHIVLEDVYHTPLGADDANGRCWYGSESVLASWADVALGKSRV